MENIIERAIVPRNPSPVSLLNKEQYSLYAPIARRGQAGIAEFDVDYFTITGQIVRINTDNIATVSLVAETIVGVKSYADGVAQTAEDNAKAHADVVAQAAENNAKEYAEEYADSVAQVAENNAKAHANTVAQVAEDNAKAHANTVAQVAEDNAKEYAEEYADRKTSELKNYTDALVSAGWTREIVNILPRPEYAKPNVIYMKRRGSGLDSNDVYDEYFLVNVNGVKTLELMGNTELDLSKYLQIGDESDNPEDITYHGLDKRIDRLRSDVDNALNEVEVVAGYDMIVTSDKEFSKLLYPMFKNETSLTQKEAATAFENGTAELGEPTPNFAAKRVLVKGVTFKTRRGFDDVRMHIFQPSLEYIRFEDCRWEASWRVSGAVPKALKCESEFKAATKLTLTISGVQITEHNVNSVAPEGWNIGFRNIARVTDCAIKYPVRYLKDAFLMKLTFQYFDAADNCEVTALWDGKNVSNCIVCERIKRCVNCVNVTTHSPLDANTFVEECRNISNFAGTFNFTAYPSTDVAATKEEVANVKASVQGIEARVSDIEGYLKHDMFVVDDTIAHSKSIPKLVCEKAKIVRLGGRTVQSENMVPVKEAGSKTSNGITFTSYGDGRYHASGTATNTIFYTFVDHGKDNDVVLEHDAILYGCPIGGAIGTYRLSVSNSEGTSMSDTGSGIILPAGYKIRDVYARIGTGTSLNGITFEPKLRYLPLIGEDAKVHSITTIGKNLIPFPYLDSDKSENDVYFSVREDFSIQLTGKATDTTYFTLFDDPNMPPKGIALRSSYVLKLFGNNLDGRVSLEVYARKDNETYSLYYSTAPENLTSFKRSEHDSGLLIRLKVEAGASFEGSKSVIVYPQIQLVQPRYTEYSYAPYSAKTYAIPEVVQALPGYSKGFGSCSNYIDFDTKRYFEEVDDVIVGNGAFDVWEPFGEYLVRYGLYPKYDGSVKPISDSVYECSTFNNCLAFKVARKYTAASWKSYLSENPIRVLAKLKYPKVTDISDILTMDGLVDVEEYGAVVFENERNEPVPSTIKYLASYAEEV